MFENQEHIDLALNNLEHAGVKGMKWGTRRASRAQNMINVGKGKGSKSDKLRAYSSTSLASIIKNKGNLKKAALSTGQKRMARIDRVQKGKASVLDKIAYYGSTKSQDIIPSSKSKLGGKASVGASVAGALVIGVGANVVMSALKASSS